MRDIRWLIHTTSSLLLLTACAKSEPAGIEKARSTLQPLVGAACSWMYGCCSDGELTYQFGDFTVDAANCTERMIDAISTGQPLGLVQGNLSDNYAGGLLVLARSLNEGRVAIKGDGVKACAAATEARACNAPVETDETGRCTPADEKPADPCDPDTLFVGQQDVGEECESPWECRPGLRCIDFGTLGVCAAAAREGETCFADGECVPGLICDYGTGTCAVGANTGEPCAYADPENPVGGTETIRCAPGLSCDPDSKTCAGGFCAPGAPCADVFNHTDCPAGLFCIGDQGQGEEDGSTTCRAPAPGGTACVSDEACASGFCDPVESICSTAVPIGGECLDNSQCESHYCPLGMCEAQLPPGSPCPNFEDAQCAGGYCDTVAVEPTCVAYGGPGDPCPAGNECNPTDELVCIEGTCQKPPFADGVSCFDGSQCQSGICYDAVCVAGTPASSPCNTDGSVMPCVLGAFCDTPADDPEATAGTCANLRRPGEVCERAEQCWGDCVVRYGQLVCDATPAFALEELWCDGE